MGERVKGESSSLNREQNFLLMNTLIIVRGLPGSGKSVLSEAIAQRLPVGSVTLLDPDLILEEEEYNSFVLNLSLTNPDLDSKYYPYRYLIHKAEDSLISRKLVIWNQPFTDLHGLEYTIRKLQKRLAERGHGSFEVLIVEVEVPVDIAQARIRSRIERGGYGPNEELFVEYVQRYETVQGLGLDYGVLGVNGTQDVSQLAEDVLRSFQS